MATNFIGIGGLAVSNDVNDIIKTMALGSCIGLIIVIPKYSAAGMAHIAIPDSANHGHNERIKNHPGYFADLAVKALLKEFMQFGPLRPSELKIKIAGGATMMDEGGVFNIGKQNLLAVRKYLWKHKLGAVAEDVGGDVSRTLWVEVGSGKSFISFGGKTIKEF